MQWAGATLRCGVRASHCGGFSCLQSMGFGHMGFSSCGSRAPKHWLTSWGARAQPLRGMWDPPRPGIELASPALPGRPLTTGPPGKPSVCSSLRLQVEQGERESRAATVLTELNPVLPKHARSQVGRRAGSHPRHHACSQPRHWYPWLDW